MNRSEWITEVFENRTAFSARYHRKLFSEVSDFQKIEIYESTSLGRVLLLNDCFMVTQQDAFVYHEMLVHPAMATLSEPRRILVVGGGDGGAVTELVKYPDVDSIILCEIDPLVVSSCREYLPEISAGLADPRVSIVHEDAATFVPDFNDEFDLVIVDSTDPVGPGKALFEVSFFESTKSCLKRDGAAVFQTESPFFMASVFVQAVNHLKSVFGASHAIPYFATVPSYPGGLWSFTFCSCTVDPIADAPADSTGAPSTGLRYYDPKVHRAAFVMPRFVRDMLEPVTRP